MNSKDTNALLRKMVLDLIDSGWLKTNIGKALLGDNGQGHVNHWLNLDGNKTNDFGIKPLSNIANQIKCELHVVFLPKDGEQETKQKLDEYNEQFTEALKNALIKYLKNDVPKPSYTKHTTSKLDLVLNEILGFGPVATPTATQNEQVIDQNDLAPEEM